MTLTESYNLSIMANRRFNSRPANNRAPWARDDENVLFADAKNGIPYDKIASKLGRSERAIKLKIMHYAKRELARLSKDDVVAKYHMDGNEFISFLENDGKLPPDTSNVRPNLSDQLDAINLKLNAIMLHLGLTLDSAPPKEPELPEKKPSTKPVKSAQKTKAEEPCDTDITLLNSIVNDVVQEIFGGKPPTAKQWEKRQEKDYNDFVYDACLDSFEKNPKSRSPCDNEFCEQKGCFSLVYKGKRSVLCDDCLHNSQGESAIEDLMNDVSKHFESNLKPSTKRKTDSA